MDEQTRALLPEMMDARNRFMELVDEIRPELHRYCARMTGSVIDGEDVVQETLAKAYYALGQMFEPPNLRPWLFRIAHNTAMDFLKRYERRNVELVSEIPDRAEVEETAIDPELVEAAIGVFMQLPSVQRSALILKDVLGHSLEEAAATMETSVGAVKAALSRARANVARDRMRPQTVPRPEPSAEERAFLERFVTIFNERDWDVMRAFIAEDARLDIVSRFQRRVADAGYVDRYAELSEGEGLRAKAVMIDSMPAIAMFSPSGVYFVLLEARDGLISRIRDFRYVPYIAADARFSAL